MFEKRLKQELKKTSIIKDKLGIHIVNPDTVYGFALRAFFEENFEYISLDGSVEVRGTCLEEEIISRFENWVDNSIRLMKTIPLEEIVEYARTRGWSGKVSKDALIEKLEKLEEKHPGIKFGLSKSFLDLEDIQNC